VDVAAASAQEVWAVGSFNGDGLIERWDGQSWSHVPIVSGPDGHGPLNAVAAPSLSDAWAVRSWALRYYDPCVTPTPFATPTRTPTLFAPTSTLTATPTGTPILT